MLIVHLATIVAEAIAHHKVVHMQEHVVGSHLVEHLLSDIDARCLVLHNHARLGPQSIHHRVTPQALLSDDKLHLVGQHRGGIAPVTDEEIDEMLPHPLLGGQRDVFSPQNVENFWFLGCSGNFYLERWQV